MLDGAVFFRESDAAAIGQSDRFAAFLLKQIMVASGGRACAGSIEPPTDLAKTGVTIDYTCPGRSHGHGCGADVDRPQPAYQTLPTGPDGERAVYGPGHDSHDWALRDASAAGGMDLGRWAVVQIAVVVGGLLLVAVAALRLFRRLSRGRRAVA